MRKSLACIFVLGLLSIGQSAQAKQEAPEELAMKGKWELAYEPTFCQLRGEFGEENARVAMQMTRYEPGDQFELRFYGKRFSNHYPFGTAITDFNSDGTSVEGWTMNGTAGNVPVIFLGNRNFVEPLPDNDASVAVTPEMEAAVTSLTLKAGSKPAIKLLLPVMGQAMRAMRTCTTELVRHWGFDPDVQAQLTRQVEPLADAGNWIRSEDYPNRALEQGGSGIIRYRLDVDENGQPTNCDVQYRTKSPDFAASTCSLLMQRARFTPALDSSGNAVRSYYVGTVYWQIHTPN